MTDERQQLVAEAYRVKEVRYQKVRKILGLHDDCRFLGLTYSSEKDPETAAFICLRGWHLLHNAIEKCCGTAVWEELQRHSDVLDAIADALTYYKEDSRVRESLAQDSRVHASFGDDGLSEEIVTALLGVDFKKVMHLSYVALKKIIPYMQEGLDYNNACERAGVPVTETSGRGGHYQAATDSCSRYHQPDRDARANAGAQGR